MSQFQRAAEELGINVIHANSPQAKGRVERLFRTFQDRLIKEMRLANVCGIEEGNRFLTHYLPLYYKRFGVVPSAEGDMHRPVSERLDFDRILCVKTERVLRNDFTVAHEGKLYQVLDNIQAKKVMVEERMDETMVIRRGEQKLRFKPILVRVQKLEPKPHSFIFSAQKARIPSFAHPWRRMILTPKHKRTAELLTAQT
jgi:hypothetical protein